MVHMFAVTAARITLYQFKSDDYPESGSYPAVLLAASCIYNAYTKLGAELSKCYAVA